MPQKPESHLLLGIDVGSSSVKVMVVDAATGAEVRTVAEPGPFVTVGARTEPTVDGLLGTVRRALDRLEPDPRRRVVGVGIAGMAESGAPVSTAVDGGRALAPIIAWHDRRGENVAQRLRATFGAGLDRAVGHRVRYVATVAKLGWLTEHWPSVSAGGESIRWLGVPELVLRALTGAEATESSLAACTGCFDIAGREWLPEVARAAGFEVDVFPPVMAAGEVMGRVSAEASVWSGLPAGVPVTVAGHDHLVGFVGSGAGTDDLANSVGTAETVVGRSSGWPDVDAAVAGGLTVSLFPGGDAWAVLTSAARSGQAADATAMTLGHPPSALDRLLGPGPGADLLDAPDLLESLRRRQPPALPTGPPAQVWATLLDALATETAAAVERVTALVGPRRHLVVFGGGSAGAPLMAAKAGRIPIPVERSPWPAAVARGAALLGGVAAGRPLGAPS